MSFPSSSLFIHSCEWWPLYPDWSGDCPRNTHSRFGTGFKSSPSIYQQVLGRWEETGEPRWSPRSYRQTGTRARDRVGNPGAVRRLSYVLHRGAAHGSWSCRVFFFFFWVLKSWNTHKLDAFNNVRRRLNIVSTEVECSCTKYISNLYHSPQTVAHYSNLSRSLFERRTLFMNCSWFVVKTRGRFREEEPGG